jgi:hypothetical protein
MIGAQGWNGAAAADDLWYLSASTIGKALARPQLEAWAERETAARVVADLHIIGPLAAQSPDAARAYVKSIRFTGSDGRLSAADRGTELHAYVEARLRGTALPTWEQAHAEQLAPYLPHIEAWLAAYMPEPIELEQVVFDPASRLAGRLDWKLRLRGRFTAWPGVADPVILFDGKSTDKGFDRDGRPFKPFADSHPLQLAALAYATHAATFDPRIVPGNNGGRFYLANPAELGACTVPAHVDGAALLSMSPVHCTAFPVDISPGVHAYARCVADAWRWAHIASKQTIGEPITRETT